MCNGSLTGRDYLFDSSAHLNTPPRYLNVLVAARRLYSHLIEIPFPTATHFCAHINTDIRHNLFVLAGLFFSLIISLKMQLLKPYRLYMAISFFFTFFLLTSDPLT